MGHYPVKGHLVLVPDQVVQQDRQQGRPVHPRPQDVLAGQQLGGVDRHLAPPDDVPDFHEGSAVAQHIDALGHQLGPSHQFHHHVSAPPVGQFPNPADPRFRRVELFDIDGVICAEFLGQLQPVLQPVQHDDPVGAHILGHGHRVQPKTAGPLDHHVLPFAQRRALQAGGHRPHRAVDRPQDFIGQLVGHTEERVPRRQVEEVRVGAGEVRPDAGGGILPVGAPVGVAPQAQMTAVAGEHGGVDDPVPFLDGGSQGVRGDPVTQGFHNPRSLMSHDPSGGRQRHEFLGLVAAPGVQVRPADSGLGHPQDYRSPFGFGNVVLLDFKRLAVLLDHNNPAFHVPPLSGFGVHTQRKLPHPSTGAFQRIANGPG